jgi:hypothetical protein
MRKATVLGDPSGCFAGTEILCFRSFENNISSPPLLIVSGGKLDVQSRIPQT